MFDLSDKREAWIPVRWDGLTADGDQVARPTQHEIELRVELVDRDRLREIFPPSDAEAPRLTGEELQAKELETFLSVARDWRKVVAGGEPVTFSEENARKLLAVPMFAQGFEAAYIAAWTGQVEIREGNSNGSSANGRAGARQKTATKR